MSRPIRAALRMALILGVLILPSLAAAEPGETAGPVAGAEPVESRLERALLKMDHDLLALLEARMMECDGDASLGGMETCFVSFDGAQPSGGPAGSVVH